MTRVICNVCRKEEPPNNNLPPIGWFASWRRGSGEADLHFCSPACGAQYFTALHEVEAKQAVCVETVKTQRAVDDGTLRLQ